MDLSEQVNEFRVLKNTIGFVCLTYLASFLYFKYKFIKQLFLRDSTRIALKSGSKYLLPKLWNINFFTASIILYNNGSLMPAYL